MSQMILEIRDGGEYSLALPPPIQMTIDQGRGPQGPQAPGVGDIDNLTTENKTSLVAAINELNMSGVSLTVLYDNAKAG